jgi:tRNA U34 5-methylaminomethyl-2-thiouridine-forming methyltransferase MnmC
MSDTGDLDWTEAGAPRSRVYGDVYFSREDGLAESRAVFLEGCGLRTPGRAGPASSSASSASAQG